MDFLQYVFFYFKIAKIFLKTNREIICFERFKFFLSLIKNEKKSHSLMIASKLQNKF